jgi:N-acetylglucosaminyldiphosphoundecaprenol N-acetyl-beta-D-mannosaminyltransferase
MLACGGLNRQSMAQMNDAPPIRTHAGQPPIAILGVPFDNLSATDAAELFARMVLSRRTHYLVSLDVDSLLEAQRDEAWRRALIDANLVLCEDRGLIRASRWLGDPVANRLSGVELLRVLLNVAVERQFRVVLLADATQKIEHLLSVLKTTHPRVLVSGSLVEPVQWFEDEATARTIAATNPDLLLVARSTLAEEQVIATRFRAWGAPICVGVTVSGAGILSAGRSKASTGNHFGFMWAVFKQWWQLRVRADKTRTQVSTPVEAGETWQCIKLPPRLDLQATRDDALLVDQVLADGRDCLLDLAAVEFIDSTGVGLLIRLQKKVKASGKQLILLAPSENVQRALKLMNLHNFFTSAPDLSAARELLNRRATQT